MLTEGTLRASYQTLGLVQDKTFWTSQALHVRRLTTRWTSQWASFTLPSCAVCIRAHGALLSRYASMCIKKLAFRTTGAFTGIWRVTFLAQWWTRRACAIRWFRILAWRENSDAWLRMYCLVLWQGWLIRQSAVLMSRRLPWLPD